MYVPPVPPKIHIIDIFGHKTLFSLLCQDNDYSLVDSLGLLIHKITGTEQSTST